MLATRTLTDERGSLRKNGEKCLITFSDTEANISGIYEKVIDGITVLYNRQYCEILDPVGTDDNYC